LYGEFLEDYLHDVEICQQFAKKEIVPKWEQKSKNKKKCAEMGTLFDF
jgi:hypothetical protein